MRRFIFFGLIVIIFVAGVVYLPGLSKYLKFKTKERALDEQIAKVEREIEALREEEQLLKSDVGRLEEVVREELGLVRPGEVVYKVVEEPMPEEKPETWARQRTSAR